MNRISLQETRKKFYVRVCMHLCICGAWCVCACLSRCVCARERERERASEGISQLGGGRQIGERLDHETDDRALNLDLV